MTRPATVHDLNEGAQEIADAAPVVHAPRLATVQEAISSVMAELPNIGKGDKSPEGYQYRGIEAVTKHTQPLFAKHGVVIAPRARVTQVVPSPAMKDGWQDVYVEVDWLITGPDGSTIEARTNGIGRDRSDKGANKGQTQAYKYLLLHLLCIADGKDDSDNQTYEHDRQEAPAPWNENQAKAHVLALAQAACDADPEPTSSPRAIAALAWPDIKDTPWTADALAAAFDVWINQPAEPPADPAEGETP